MSTKKAFLWAWLHRSLEVLVPRQRGKGWLKVPAGHHAEKRVRELEIVSGVDVYGLDGTLSFQCEIYSNESDERKAFEALVFPVIETHYKCSPGHEVSYGEIERLLKD
jgi:hypothetical protein